MKSTGRTVSLAVGVLLIVAVASLLIYLSGGFSITSIDATFSVPGSAP